MVGGRWLEGRIALAVDGERCTRCGKSLTGGHCPQCDDWRVRFVHREVVLLSVLIAVTVAVYGFTRAAEESNSSLQRADAVVLFQQAQEAEQRGDLDAAIPLFRRAVTHSPDERLYRLSLADALSRDSLDDEAERVLLELRERLPEDAEISLRLARIEARRLEGAAARRYYQAALAALWMPDQADERSRLRIELIRFLLDQDERTRALSELLVLMAEVTGDAELQTEAGHLLLEAGDASLALEMFAPVLDEHPDAQDALAGAGEAAYLLGDYTTAASHLESVTAPTDALVEIRTVTDLVLDADPLAPRLGAAERRRRLSMIVTQALRRLDACLLSPIVGVTAPGVEVAAVRTEAQSLLDRLESRRQQSRDNLEEGLVVARQLEQLVGDGCGDEMPLDSAIVLIAARHGLESQ